MDSDEQVISFAPVPTGWKNHYIDADGDYYYTDCPGFITIGSFADGNSYDQQQYYSKVVAATIINGRLKPAEDLEGYQGTNLNEFEKHYPDRE